MTATIVDLKCPACGHLVGQEEYERIVANFNRFVDEKAAGEIEQLTCELYAKDQQMHDLEELHKHNVENLVNEKVELKKAEMRKELEEEFRIENDEAVQRALIKQEKQFEKDRAGYNQHIQRVEKKNKELSAKVDEQTRILENIHPESNGTRGELVLLEELHKAFPDDELIQKKVGVEMGDIIQTVVENGRKIAPPIVWDNKEAAKVTPLDILKAKNYKVIHNTDYSIIVTEKGITTKDSNNMMFGEREDIKLVHPEAVIDIARIFRSFIIDNAKLTSSNKDRTSKEARLYEYLKSSEYGRTIETMKEAKMKLDELQRREEKYHKETLWKNRTEIIEAWIRIVEQNQKKIDDVMGDQTNGDSKDDSNI
jgi:hypothetical protein